MDILTSPTFWGAVAAIGTVVAAVFGAAGFMRSGNNAAEARLTAIISGVKSDLGKRIDEVKTEVKAVQTRLQEHETRCADRQVEFEKRLTKLES